MRKLLLTLLSIGAVTTATANETITIGASSVPHADILKFITPALKKQGYDLKITEFSDYITPNIAVYQKSLDANYFQTKPYLAQYNKDHHTNLVDLVDVHLEPMGAYAAANEAKFIKSKKGSDLVKGSKIAVPNDPTNEGRALNILEANGIIKIKSGFALPTKKDIIDNPYQVEIVELDPAMLPRVLKGNQVNIAIINSNIAMQSGLNPVKDSVLIENTSSPFANLVAIRPEEVNEPKMKALVKAITSPETKKFIVDKYKGAVVPTF
jgi:D-methionine transport system substrate-binding protein